MTRRETLELVRAYFTIADPKVRDQVLALAKSLAAPK
ncbi:transcriptional regulator [Paramagnetospirillum caucaseum]|uniref:Transcriptional regulator n=1 Tax=Paramagnetospirillum caucaseum TaxID=1244869 RepID=M2Y355_9PROT|nr:transcriptional regulator [Paramagnetospirillum caucaseum]